MPVAGPVECDQPHAEPVQHRPAWTRAQPAPRSPVQQEDGNAVRIAEQLDRQQPPVSGLYRVPQGISFSGVPGARRTWVARSKHRAAGAASEGMTGHPLAHPAGIRQNSASPRLGQLLTTQMITDLIPHYWPAT